MLVLDAILCAPVRGMEKGKRLSLRSRERKLFFRAHYAHLSKVLVFDAILGAPVRGMERGKLLSLRSRERESCFSGLAMLTSQKWWFLWQFSVHQ